MSHRLLAALCTTCSLAAQTTWIVDSGNPNALPTLAAAVGVSADGDTIVIRHAGEWIGSTIVLNKSLHIVGDCPTIAGGTPTLAFFSTGMQVQVPAGKELLLANVTLLSYHSYWQPPAKITIAGCGGRVVLQDLPASFFGIDVVQSPQVMMSRVAMTMATPMLVDHSTVVCDRCTLTGLAANYETSAPSVAAMDLQTATVHCVDTAI